MNDKNLRKNLVEILTGKSAHLNLYDALEGLNPELRTVKPKDNLYSIWELLEHLRISVEDIFRYTMDSNWVSPSWPEGHWPEKKKNITDDDWENSIKKYKLLIEEMVMMINNPDLDLTSEFSHGEGRTYMRQVLIAADHNSYHTGQIIFIRKLLGNWNK